MPRHQSPQLLSIADAAEMLSLSPITVKRLISSGELVSLTIGRSRRIPAEALSQFIASRLEATEAEGGRR